MSMNRYFKSALLTVLLVSLSAFSISCTHKAGKVTQMPPMEAMGMLRNDFAVIVDAREPDQQKDGVAQGALLMPASKIEVSKLPKGKRIIVYGATPAEATKVAEHLAADGFDVGVIGTYEDWVKAGLPVQKR